MYLEEEEVSIHLHKYIYTRLLDQRYLEARYLQRK